MIKWALNKAMDKFEREWKYDASYMRDIIDASPLGAWKFSRAAALGQFRRDVPLEPWYAAGITAVRREDCGPCTQLGVAMAERAGVSPAVLRAVLSDDPDAMPPDVALAWKFTRATLAHDLSADEFRDEIVKRWGRLGLISLAFAITASRIYPTVKYALGHGKACTLVYVGVHTSYVRSRARCRSIGRGGAHGVTLQGTSPDSAASFEPYRRRLLGLAYRMLGSMADAEDAVQETWLRWHGADRSQVLDPRAFLMTTTARICLDLLTSARARHEEYAGPLVAGAGALDTAALAPDSHTELAEDLSIALLLTLDRLSPLERAAFLLHDVFDFSFGEVAATLERSEAACRQLAARARDHVRGARPRGAAPAAPTGEIDAKHTQLLSAFMAASRSGDLHGLMQLLATDVRIVTDGGGKAAAAMNVLDGADRAARFLVGATRKGWREDFTVRFATINGLPGVIVDAPEGPVQTAAFEIDGAVIRAVYVVRNPDKLRHVS